MSWRWNTTLNYLVGLSGHNSKRDPSAIVDSVSISIINLLFSRGFNLAVKICSIAQT